MVRLPSLSMVWVASAPSITLYFFCVGFSGLVGFSGSGFVGFSGSGFVGFSGSGLVGFSGLLGVSFGMLALSTTVPHTVHSLCLLPSFVEVGNLSMIQSLLVCPLFTVMDTVVLLPDLSDASIFCTPFFGETVNLLSCNVTLLPSTVTSLRFLSVTVAVTAPQ